MLVILRASALPHYWLLAWKVCIHPCHQINFDENQIRFTNMLKHCVTTWKFLIINLERVSFTGKANKYLGFQSDIRQCLLGILLRKENSISPGLSTLKTIRLAANYASARHLCLNILIGFFTAINCTKQWPLSNFLVGSIKACIEAFPSARAF